MAQNSRRAGSTISPAVKKIPSFIQLPFKRENPVSSADSDEDKYPESFPRYFIQEFTKKGDKVFDPFIGHGTTAIVAEELGRIPFGVEADEPRFEWICSLIQNTKNMRCMDADNLADAGFPKMDFCVTSPPFMAINHSWNPLYEGDPVFGTYDAYLKKLRGIFKNLKFVMKKNALLVVHADNVHGQVFTPLVRDFSICISGYFKPVGETIIQWQNPIEHYPISRALIFRNSLQD